MISNKLIQHRLLTQVKKSYTVCNTHTHTHVKTMNKKANVQLEKWTH